MIVTIRTENSTLVNVEHNGGRRIAMAFGYLADRKGGHFTPIGGQIGCNLANFRSMTEGSPGWYQELEEATIQLNQILADLQQKTPPERELRAFSVPSGLLLTYASLDSPPNWDENRSDFVMAGDDDSKIEDFLHLVPMETL
jgi:hypothetical protein